MIYKILLPLLIIALLAVLWFGGGGDYLKENISLLNTKTTTALTTPSPTPTVTKTVTINPTVTIAKKVSNVPEGWQTYTNTKYGFSISYPPNYKALTSKDDLYGWDKAVVLFYGGGQSYDVAVEVWDSEAGYKEKYPGIEMAVYLTKGKVITLYDETKEPENKTIINSFVFTN